MKHDNDNAPATGVAGGQPLRFLSVCSGIEAASVAWRPLGWEAVAFSEIEKFPSAVLAHHYPDVPNLGDFTKIDTTTLGQVDVLCGGTPCQAFSVAGLRGGLNDARGNLTLAFVELAHALSAGNGLRNVVWENVVGVLSDKTNAFGCFLAGLVGATAALEPPTRGKWGSAGLVSGPKGRAAWRVLDAQFFGVAQRRRRVLVVADFGNGADPAEVLFELEGVQRHTPPSREARKDIAPTISARPSGGGGLGTDFDLDGGLVQHSVDVAPCLRAGGNSTGGDRPYGTDADTADSLVSYAIQAGALRTNPKSGPDGVGVQSGVAYTLEARAEVQAVAYDGRQWPADVAPTLNAAFGDKLGLENQHINSGAEMFVPQSVAIRGRDGGATAELGGEVATALRASQGGGDKPHVLTNVVAFNAEAQADQLPGDGRDTSQNDGLTVSQRAAASVGSAVRRLTPRECERLQGFQFLCSPDYPGAWQDDAGRWWSPDYTAIPYGNKLKGEVKEELAAYFERTGQYMKEVAPDKYEFDRVRFEREWPRMAADGPRYKALGNSWAVPKFTWLGRRLQAALARRDTTHTTSEAA